MSAKENVEVMRQIFETVERRDAQRMLGLCHADVEFHWPTSLPYGGMARGQQPGRATWSQTWDRLQPTEAERQLSPRVVAARQLSPRVVAASDEEVVVEWQQRGLSPNGDRFESPVLGLYRIRNGKLARAQMFYFDTAAVVRFLEKAEVIGQSRKAS